MSLSHTLALLTLALVIKHPATSTSIQPSAPSSSTQPKHSAPSTRPQPPAPSPQLKHQQSARSALVSDSLWSQSLGIRKHLVIWLPPSYSTEPARRYPVAYYLHGAFGNETDWTRVGALDRTLDSLAAAGMPEMIVVMPDGDDGWYSTWNWLGDWPGCRRDRPANAEPAATYCVPWPHYDDYIARDVVAFIDRSYRTLADRRHRGLAGLSMGGYGAFALALAYPDVFAAAASHSGAIAPVVQRAAGAAPWTGAFDLDAMAKGYGPRLMSQLLAAFGKDSIAWAARQPLFLAQRAVRAGKPLPALRADCGSEDMFIGQNRVFRDEAARAGIALDYAEFPGAHNWDYWRRHASESAQWLARQLSVP